MLLSILLCDQNLLDVCVITTQFSNYN